MYPQHCRISQLLFELLLKQMFLANLCDINHELDAKEHSVVCDGVQMHWSIIFASRVHKDEWYFKVMPPFKL